MDPNKIFAECTELLFRKSFGVDIRTVDQYRKKIGPIPESLFPDDADLPFISLCDPRLGLLRSCKLFGIQYEELGYTDDSAVPFDDRFPLPTTPFWFRHDDGRKNNGRRPDHCRDELTGGIQTGSALEGAFAYAHHPTIVVEGEHVIDLPRTVPRSARVFCAYLRVWHGQAGLSLGGHSDIASPSYGSLCVRRK